MPPIVPPFARYPYQNNFALFSPSLTCRLPLLLLYLRQARAQLDTSPLSSYQRSSGRAPSAAGAAGRTSSAAAGAKGKGHVGQGFAGALNSSMGASVSSLRDKHQISEPAGGVQLAYPRSEVPRPRCLRVLPGPRTQILNPNPRYHDSARF